jgi:hypothetical protein
MIQRHGDIMANDDANTARLGHQIEEVRAEVVQLMNTPLGRSVDFPIK